MDPSVLQALKLLGFEDPTLIPKVREIYQRYKKLAYLKHPDRNNGSPEATAEFQDILNAYHLAGEAAESVPADPEDKADQVARKLFEQFQVKSVKENSKSVTIHTEKVLYPTWMETLTSFAGLPENKGPHGNKFTVEDTFNDTTVKFYLTMYRTGKLLVQAEKSKHSINLHFLNTHLENLFTQVYKKNTNQKTIQNQDKLKTPITKPVKTAGRISKISLLLSVLVNYATFKLQIWVN